MRVRQNQKKARTFLIVTLIIVIIGYALAGNFVITGMSLANISKSSMNASTQNSTMETSTIPTANESTTSSKMETTKTTPEGTVTNDSKSSQTSPDSTSSSSPSDSTISQTPTTGKAYAPPAENQAENKTMASGDYINIDSSDIGNTSTTHNQTSTMTQSNLGTIKPSSTSTLTPEEKDLSSMILVQEVSTAHRDLPETLPMANVIFILENKGGTPLTLEPRLLEKTINISHEDKIRTHIRQNLLIATPTMKEQELQQAINNKLQTMRILDAKKVKLVYNRKLYHPFSRVMDKDHGRITPSGQLSTGTLLYPELITGNAIMLEPFEKKTVNLQVRSPLSTQEEHITLAFLSQGQEVAATSLSFARSSTRIALNVDPQRDVFDVYVLINQQDQPNPQEPEEQPSLYYVEISLIQKGHLEYFELLGPYSFALQEPIILSQELSYDPAAYTGEYVVDAALFKDTQEIVRNSFKIELG